MTGNGTEEPAIAGRKPLLDRAAEIPVPVLLAAGAIVFAAFSCVSLFGESATADEIAHLHAGYRQLTTGEFGVPPHFHAPPVLAKTWIATPLLFQTIQGAWRTEWYEFFYQSGNDPDFMLRSARMACLFWPILLILSVYAFARESFGPRGGVVSLALGAFCPTLLAHGHLVTTDVPLASLFFLTVVAFTKLFAMPGRRWSVYCGVLLGGALATKHSAVLLLPIVACMAMAAMVLRIRQNAKEEGGTPSKGPIKQRLWLRAVGSAATIGILAYTVLWAAYGFRYSATLNSSSEFKWDFDPNSLTIRAVIFARDHRLLPEAYLYGYAMIQEFSAVGDMAYALGRYSEGGWWWYFPFAFLVKTPLPTLALFGWGLHSCLRRCSKGLLADQFLLPPLIVYCVIAMNSKLNIGVRHMMPVLPFLMVLAGGIEFSGLKEKVLRWQRTAVLACLAATVLDVVSQTPYFLAYFNAPSRWLADRHYMLADSNLDWGQDLGRLKHWMDREGITEIKLAYFGNGSPRHEKLQHQVLPGFNSYVQYEKEWKRAAELRSGDWVALSATSFVGVLSDDKDYYLRQFRNMKPVATIGHSILLYQVPDRRP